LLWRIRAIGTGALDQVRVVAYTLVCAIGAVIDQVNSKSWPE
jgi:hypothetical protein